MRVRKTLSAGLVGVAVAACSSGATPEDAGPGSAVGPGVGIVAEGCSLSAQIGSGVIVGADNSVVTVAHTLSGASRIFVIDDGGAEHRATVRAFDKDADLAVLDAPTLDAEALSLADVSLGAGATLTWSRDGGVELADIEVTKRLEITIEDIYRQGEFQRSGLEVAGEIRVGDSGGAVLNSDGAVIGIIYARSRAREGVGFATDSSEIAAVVAARGGDVVDNGRCV